MSHAFMATEGVKGEVLVGEGEVRGGEVRAEVYGGEG